MELKNICEPLNINNITLPNRVVFPAFQTNFATTDGYVTERLLKMYDRMAQGGSGLIITGCMAVSDDGVPDTNVLKINHDKFIEPLREFFITIKKNGVIPGVQLIHAGRQTSSAMTGHPLVAPSATPCPVMKETPVELDEEGIRRIQEDFVNSAVRAKEAGAELIELHGAFGYLIGGFLSPYSNKREDRYGTDKTLFFTEIIKKVKKKVGNTPISCRISAHEFVEGGLTLEESTTIAPKLVEAGADIINVGAGTYASMDHMAPTKDMGEGVHVHLAAAIQEVVEVPVMCAGNIHSLEFADTVISEKRSDLVAICRQQVADPLFIRTSLNGGKIIKCTNCNRCMFFLWGERSVSCPQNPEL